MYQVVSLHLVQDCLVGLVWNSYPARARPPYGLQASLDDGALPYLAPFQVEFAILGQNRAKLGKSFPR